MTPTLSLSATLHRIYAGVKRFPLTIALCVIEAMLCIYMNHREYRGDTMLPDIATYYLPFAAMLSVALKLWSEEMANKLLSYGIQIVAHVAWIFIAMWWRNYKCDGDIEAITPIAIISFFFVLMCTSAFHKAKDDIKLWNFTFRFIIACIVAMVVGLIMTGGLAGLYWGVNTLFTLNLTDKIFVDILILCMIVIAPVVLLQFIPQGTDKHNESNDGLPRLFSGVVHYLFMPLLGLYIVVLYFYGAKILLSWTLPNGMVSAMVSAMIVGTLAIIALIYPSKWHTDRRIDNLAMRWLPIIALPLLLLMTVATWRRVSDYGLTTLRLYLITFNVWSYAAFLYLILYKHKKFSVIPVSFSVIFFITSVGPWNYDRMMFQKFYTATLYDLKNYGAPELPMTVETFQEWYDNLDKPTQKEAINNLEYLASNYRKLDLSDIADDDVLLEVRGYKYSVKEIDEETGEKISAYVTSTIHDRIDISGYTTMAHVFHSIYDVEMQADSTLIISLPDGYQLNTSIQELRQNSGRGIEKQINLYGKNVKFNVSVFNYTVGEEKIELRGTIIMK